jgi:glucose/arabinose dehydrogenase
MNIQSSIVCRLAALLGAVIMISCGDDDDSTEPASQPPSPPAPPAFTLGVERAFPLLRFVEPVSLLQAPADATGWFVVEQRGRVVVFANNPGVATAGIFVDISDRVSAGGEMGLLGMAFHPNFPADPRVYLSYTNVTSGNRANRLSEFRLGADGALDTANERVLMSIDQPAANHNGGQIAFGPDGYLYIGRGDGGGANDQHGSIGNAQSFHTLLGKLLRIDVDVSAPASYGIPPTNPFANNPLCGDGGVGMANCPEIYAYGLRNPWRWSFDRATGALWLGDVGQNLIEEINRVELGGNYGWRCFEGTRPTDIPCGPAQNFSPPVAQYTSSGLQAVTGGYVYRGSAIPGLAGRYLFADFYSGMIWDIPAGAAPTIAVAPDAGLATGLNVASFAEGVDGELYVVHYSGELYRLVGR